MSDKYIKCPDCELELFEKKEYIDECVNSYINLTCDCGCDFKLSAKCIAVEWSVERIGK